MRPPALLRCPHCRSTKSQVLETRGHGFKPLIFRRRRCLQCKQMFYTHEVVVMRLPEKPSSNVMM